MYCNKFHYNREYRKNVPINVPYFSFHVRNLNISFTHDLFHTVKELNFCLIAHNLKSTIFFLDRSSLCFPSVEKRPLFLSPSCAVRHKVLMDLSKQNIFTQVYTYQLLLRKQYHSNFFMIMLYQEKSIKIIWTRKIYRLWHDWQPSNGVLLVIIFLSSVSRPFCQAIIDFSFYQYTL